MVTSLDLRTELKRIIESCAGPERAISAGKLAARFGYKDDRIIRLAIRELRRTEPVLSSGNGYYWPENEAQVQECLDSLRGRLIEDAKTRRDIKNSARAWLEKVSCRNAPAETQGRLI